MDTRPEYEISEYNLRSQEVNEILGVPPGWIVRRGTTLILIIIAVVFVGSAFFRYPDIVKASAVITTQNPPSVLLARASGKIAYLFFTDGSHVEKGDTIGTIENPAKYKDIVALSRVILSYDPDNILKDLPGSINGNNLNFGEVQVQFSAFSKAHFEYRLFIKQNFRAEKIKALEVEEKYYTKYYDRLENQIELSKKDLQIAQKQYTRDSLLYVTGVIPAIEAERSQSNLIVKQQLLENAHTNLTNIALTVVRLKQSISDLRFEQENLDKTLKEDLVNSYNLLKSALSSWEKSYLLIAPASGKLTYMNVWSNLQEVRSGDPLFTINPETRGQTFALVTIPAQGAGKVKPGERVVIKLDGYPYTEYGFVEGYIQSISNGATEKGFPSTVNLTRGAVTSFGYELNFDKDLTGIAEITTEELTLLQRFFNPLRYVFSSRFSKNMSGRTMHE